MNKIVIYLKAIGAPFKVVDGKVITACKFTQPEADIINQLCISGRLKLGVDINDIITISIK